MAITSGFFDSINSDRTYDAEQMTNYFEGLVSDGIYQNIGEALVVKATGDGLNITVGSGRALVKTHWMKNDAPITLTLSPASTENDRYDSIFLRYNATTREVNIYVAEGSTDSAQYVTPTQTNTIYDLFLAMIWVKKNTSVLSQSAIHDYRGSAACPWITGLIKQVDTSELFLQFQTAYEQQYEDFETKVATFDAYMAQKQADFDTWFQSLTEELRVDTTLHEYRDSYEITAGQEAAKLYPFTIENYEAGSDILFVMVDGIVMTENVDFVILKFDEHFPDINGTGTITNDDASLIFTAFYNIEHGQPSGLTEAQEKAADANMSGAIDVDDITLTREFYTNGTYENNFEGWTQFIEDLYGITIDSEYYIVPLKSVYQEGSQMTIRIIKSVIGEGSSAAISSGDIAFNLNAVNNYVIGDLQEANE